MHILIYYMYFTCTIYDIVLPNKYLSIMYEALFYYLLSKSNITLKLSERYHHGRDFYEDVNTI